MEIRKMAKASLNSDKEYLRMSGRYLIIITAFFFAGLAPGVVLIGVLAYLHKMPNRTLFHGIVTIPQSLYGIINVILYGWINTSYRGKVKRMSLS